jgi:hypothetical protein
LNKGMSVGIGFLEGRAYILGRKGHIYIDSPMVSKRHAEMKIINGRIYLRDLNSTNGTYLLKNNRLVYFEEGYVSSLQPIVIGDQKYTIQSLLEIASNFVATDNSQTQANIINRKGSSRG